MGGSVVRSTLNQGKGTLFNFIAYFVCGIPISFYLAFNKDMGITGIWIGPAFAVAFLTLSYNLVIVRIKWVELIQTIQDRSAKEKEAKAKLDKERNIQTEEATEVSV